MDETVSHPSFPGIEFSVEEALRLSYKMVAALHDEGINSEAPPLSSYIGTFYNLEESET